MPNYAAVTAELGDYVKAGNGDVRDWIYAPDSPYDPYTTTLTKVNGKYPTFSGMLTHVVQQFKPVWNKLGEAKFFAKVLETFRQKVNFEEVAKEMYNSWLSETQARAVEGKSRDAEPFAIWLMNALKKQVKRDLRILEGTGVFVDGTGNFGESMNGMVTLMNNMKVSGNPFKIPVPVITSTNIVDVVDIFDLSVPSFMRDLCPAYFMSERNLQRYKRRYRALYGQDMDYQKGNTAYSWTNNKLLIGFKSWNGSDTIMTTPEGNWLKLIDVLEMPEITDVQYEDYLIKIFMEFSLAYDFMLDEVVYISDPTSATRGLDTNHSLWYPEEDTDPVTLS
jgi:hypothetical protein